MRKETRERVERLAQTMKPLPRPPLAVPLVEQLRPLFLKFEQILNNQNGLLEEISSREIPEPKITIKPVVDVPEPTTNFEWEFTINRDNRGLISTITAKRTEED